MLIPAPASHSQMNRQIFGDQNGNIIAEGMHMGSQTVSVDMAPTPYRIVRRAYQQ